MAFLKKISLNGVSYDLSALLQDKKGLVADAETGALGIALAENGGVEFDEAGALKVKLSDVFGVDDKTIKVGADNKIETALCLKKVAATDDTTANSYQLGYMNGETFTAVAGDTIDIAKDRFIKSIEYKEVPVAEGSEETKHVLEITYVTVDGSDDVVDVDVEELFDPYEAGKGMELVDGTKGTNKFQVKIDGDSEDFLSVSATGVKLSGVQDAIDNAIDALEGEATGSDNTAAEGEASNAKVTVTVSSEDGEVSGVTVVTNDIASAALLGEKNEGFTATTAFGQIAEVKEALEDTVGDLNADFTGDNAVSSTDGHVTVGLKEEEGVITTVTVATDDIASAELLGEATEAADIEGDTAFAKIAQALADAKAYTDAHDTDMTYDAANHELVIWSETYHHTTSSEGGNGETQEP